jgi:hypothetical protein
MRKNLFDFGYFKNIETESQAYWLGFIAADGNVQNSTKNRSLSIGLSIKDKNHLIKFSKDLNYTGNIVFSDKSCRINLYSKQMVEDLENNGITVCKSHTVRPWIGESSLMRHYWRGVFDGDGSISCFFRKRKTAIDYKVWNVNLCGNKFMVQGFIDFIQREVSPPYNQSKIKTNSSIFIASYGGIRPSQNVMNLLYHNSNSHLDRKYEKYSELMATSLKPTIISHIDKNVLLPLYEEHGNWSKVAQQLNVSHNGLYKHVRKLNLPRDGRSRKSA